MLIVTMCCLLVMVCGVKGLMPKKKGNVVETTLFCFFCIPVILTLIAVMMPSHLHVEVKNIFYIFLSVSLVLIIKDKGYYRNNFREILNIFLFIFFVLIIYFFLYGFELRYFESPDNHGFASAIGYFSSNFSYNYLKREYLQATGLTDPIFLYQSTPTLPSVWTIPNLQLRYTSDMIFAVGRIGLPLLGAVLGSAIDPLNNFPVFMLLMGVIGASSSAFLFIKIYQVSSAYLFIRSDCIKNCRPLTLCILTFSGWATLFILEGTLTQLWLIVAYQYHILQLLKGLMNKDQQNDRINLFIAPIFISVAYPHGSILLLLISAPIIFLKYLRTDLYKIGYEVFGTLSFIPFSIYFLGANYFFLVARMLKGDSGIPYNLGASNILQYLPGIPYTFFPAEGQKYINYLESILITKISSAILVILLIYLAIRFHHKYKKIDSVFLGLIPLGLSILVAYMAFKNPFQPYLYSRYCILYITIGLPINLSQIIFFLRLSKYELNKIINIFIFFAFTATSISFLFYVEKFKLYSERFNLIDSMNEIKFLDLENSIIVSDVSDHRILSLSLFTKSYYLTLDEAYSFITPTTFDEQPVKVYKVSIEKANMSFQLIGTLIVTKNLDHKISAREMLTLPNFSPK